MKKYIALGLLGIAAISFAGSNYLYNWIPKEEPTEQMVDMQERSLIEAAIENGDYQAFSELQKISQEQFQEMSERKNIMKEVKAAIDSKDYNAWVLAVAKLPNGDKLALIIDEEDFDTYLEINSAMANPTMKGKGCEMGCGIGKCSHSMECGNCNQAN